MTDQAQPDPLPEAGLYLTVTREGIEQHTDPGADLNAMAVAMGGSLYAQQDEFQLAPGEALDVIIRVRPVKLEDVGDRLRFLGDHRRP